MRYHKLDGWRGYAIPQYAVAGSSDTGMAYDSPARSVDAKAEIERVRAEVLRPAKIRSRVEFGRTSNVFAGKRWVVVHSRDYAKAEPLVRAWRSKRTRIRRA